MSKLKLISAYVITFLGIGCAVGLIVHFDEQAHGHQEMSYQEQLTQLTSITSGEFDHKLLEEKTFSIFIGQKDCSACEELLPLYIESSQKFEGERFYLDFSSRVNVDMKGFYGVTGTPTVLFVKQGKIIERMVGSTDNDEKDLLMLREGYAKID